MVDWIALEKSGVIRHMILMPKTSEESPWYGWYELLAKGVLIFHQSASFLQFLVEKFEKDAVKKLFLEGPQSLKNLEKEYREMIEKERQEQDEAYALDKIALQEEPIEDFLVKLKLARRMRYSCRKTF